MCLLSVYLFTSLAKDERNIFDTPHFVGFFLLAFIVTEPCLLLCHSNVLVFCGLQYVNGETVMISLIMCMVGFQRLVVKSTSFCNLVLYVCILFGFFNLEALLNPTKL